MSETDRTETPRDPAVYDATTPPAAPPPGHALPGRPAAPTAAAAGGETIHVERERTPEPDEARREIERTRARMSRTIDEIEGALVRKRTEIRDRFDPMDRVRRHPVPSAAAAFGAGLALGFLTGGGDDEREDELHPARVVPSAAVDEEVQRLEERSGSWEERTRRLLRVARAQEQEIDRLRARLDTLEAGSASTGAMRMTAVARPVAHRDPRDPDDASGVVHDLRSAAGELRDSVLGGIAAVLTDAFHQLREGSHHGGRD